MPVYTVGTWGRLHVLHFTLLRRCRQLGYAVDAGVASDSVVSTYEPKVLA